MDSTAEGSWLTFLKIRPQCAKCDIRQHHCREKKCWPLGGLLIVSWIVTVNLGMLTYTNIYDFSHAWKQSAAVASAQIVQRMQRKITSVTVIRVCFDEKKSEHSVQVVFPQGSRLSLKDRRFKTWATLPVQRGQTCDSCGEALNFICHWWLLHLRHYRLQAKVIAVVFLSYSEVCIRLNSSSRTNAEVLQKHN